MIKLVFILIGSIANFSLLWADTAQAGFWGLHSDNQFESRNIENLIQEKLPNASVGIFLQDAKTGKILYERRAKEAFLPASTAKIITTAASLFLLGPQFQYQTVLKTQASSANTIKAGILTGDVYLEFSGDPSLKTEDLHKLVQELKAAGIKQIKGNLILDDSLFEGKVYPSGWTIDDMPWYFAAPISTVIINENKVQISLKPSNTLGGKANIALSPVEALPIKIEQNVISVTDTEARDNCQLDLSVDQTNNIHAKGCWPAAEKETVLKVALQNPNLAAAQILETLLKSENIVLTGKVMSGIAPKKGALTTLAAHHSDSLGNLLKFVLEDSNNLYAESLLKTLGVKQFQQGSFQAGLKAEMEVLRKRFGIDTTFMRLRDGSGKSRYDAITPTQLGRVLYVMYHNPEFGKLFKERLPNSGNTGTLKRRMESFDVQGLICAKTGTFTGASALTGYINSQKKEDLIFVIMINGVINDQAAARQLEDELSRLFLQF